jgi:pyrroline-5-carboxylate reductase
VSVSCATAESAGAAIDLRQKRVAVIGAGKMGGILLNGLLGQGLLSPEKTVATIAHGDQKPALPPELEISIGTDNKAAVNGADIVLLCVKPQQLKGVLEQVRPVTTPDQLFVSIAASVPTSYMENVLGEVPVVRCMPNTPCMLGYGMTGICKGKYAQDRHLRLAQRMFDTVGRTVVVDEKHMDAVTALSASGPAYIYIILESLAEAGVKVGLPRDLSTLLAAQTALGASQMVLQTGQHPALLKDAVTTPGGCTIDGIMELEEGKLRVTLIKTVMKAAKRAKELIFTD